MSQTSSSETPVTRLVRFIVNKQKAFFLVFLAAVLFYGSSIDKVVVNNDITSYLPAETETQRGLTLMDRGFTTYASAQVMFSNVIYHQAEKITTRLVELDGVPPAAFDDSTDHFKDPSALFSVPFAGGEGSLEADTALTAVKELAAPYDHYVSPSGDPYDSDSLVQGVTVILVIVATVIAAVFLLTSRNYLEVLVFLIVFVVSTILNMGTNFLFDSVLFITNAIAAVLQPALAIDYVVVFCHCYTEERDNDLDAQEADIAAPSKTIVEIPSSPLTIISGLAALMLMQLRIGFDMDIVLPKSIVCSMLSVFLLMPGLLVPFNRGTEKIHHKNLVLSIAGWGRLIIKLRSVLPAVFAMCVTGGTYCSNQCGYVFPTDFINPGDHPETRIAMDRINKTFGYTNTTAILVLHGDYDNEGAMLRRVEALNNVTTATDLANIEVESGRYLIDKLTSRQFAELAGIDIELAQLLCQAYGLSVEEYGAIFQDTGDYSVPLLDVLQFPLEQKDKGVIRLSGEQASQVEELQDALGNGLQQLQGEQWIRMVFTADFPKEEVETYVFLDQIRAITAEYYGDDVVLVGNSTNTRDLAASPIEDNLKISVLTVLLVMVTLSFTFKSAGLPILLVLIIQGSIWINFSSPFLTGTNLFFTNYLIVSAIQVGTTIDYAIVITSRYLQLKAVLGHRVAVVEALNQNFPTVLTSSSIMTVAGFLIDKLSTDTITSSIGDILDRGTLISIVLAIAVLPQLLVLGDTLTECTAITPNRDREQHLQNDIIYLDGHVRDHVPGFIDGEFKDVLHGSVDVLIESKRQELDETEE